MPSATAGWSSACARPRRRGAGPERPGRGGRALLLQAAGLQGRVRGRAPVHRRGVRAPSWRASSRADYKLRFHLAPPLLRGPRSGDRRARRSASTVPGCCPRSKLLARLKRLRGTALRPLRLHRRAAHRAATDRRLRGGVEELLGRPRARQPCARGPDRLAFPSRSAATATSRQRHLELARQREAELLAAYRAPVTRLTAAE